MSITPASFLPRKPIYVHGQGGSMTPRNKVTLQKKFSMMIDA